MANVGRQLRMCKYGSLCYRKNVDHRNEFCHPGEESKAINDDPTDIKSKDKERTPLSLDPSLAHLSCAVSPHLVDKEIRDAVTGECELDSCKGSKDVETSELGQGVSPSTYARPIVGISAKKVDTVLLLLIGVPGSGKSTFCSMLTSSAAQPWTRICQDIIAKGKRGTKQQCLGHAEHAFAKRHNVVIDRCNINKVDRLEFLQLARNVGVEAHAVVLNLPVSVCIQRAAKRVGHEGNVDARNAWPVVTKIFRSRELPSLTEGFSRITFCRTDSDTEKVTQLYSELVPGKPLESGVFGSAVNKGNMKSHGNGSNQENGSLDTGRAQQVLSTKQESLHAQVACEDYLPNRVEARNLGNLSCRVPIEDQGARTLAFPSISTSDFHFDHERAASVILETVSEFLFKTENSHLRVVLVDLTSDSHMLSLVRQKAQEKGVDSNRFFTFVGDITKLRSSSGPACNIIANAANWRLKAGGGGVNAAIYKAAGPELDLATKKVVQTLQPGTSAAVRLPASSPLNKQEGVTHVIHVLGPNMNPQRPNYLSGDYTEGCRILRSAYASLFWNFASVVGLSESVSVSGIAVSDISQKPTKNAFTVLMQASKRKSDVKDSNARKSKGRSAEDECPPIGRGMEMASVGSIRSSGYELSKLENQLINNLSGTLLAESSRAVAPKDETEAEKQEGLRGGESGNQGGGHKVRRWDGWALGLQKVALHPEQHKDTVLQVTDEAVVLPDLFPKAKKHLLVVARRPGLDTIEDVQKKHLSLLQHMHSLAEKWAGSFLKEDTSLSFRIGYHSVPSMRQLHLHVISQDFDAPSLKNKKHWNSFTTPFFLDSRYVINELEREGQLEIHAKDSEELLEVELRCHRCCSAHPNIPRLKQHISTCKRPLANVSPAYLITGGS